MNTVITVLGLLTAIIVSGYAARLVKLPLPLVQIALGAALAFTVLPRIALDPELFFLLFLPPLLFLDGWRIPKEALFRDSKVILELAVGLVVLTVVGLGFILHWLIPAVPLPVAFAIAAVVSPTDPVAVSAIVSGAPVPKRMMHILEGESLLNDASGLVCMSVAVAAMMTGAFSIGEAVGLFLWEALGGIAVGAILTWATSRLSRWVNRRLGEDASAQILISLLIPFGAYLAAEQVHCSGILAAVAAGIMMSFTQSRDRGLVATRVRLPAVWDTVQFAANGAVFVLLGQQLPALLARAPQTVLLTGHQNPWWLLVYVLAVVAVLALLRLGWIWVSLRLTLYRTRRRTGERRKVSLRLLLAMAAAGVRGAITLAGVLTLPLVLTDGAPFPARDLAILLAAGVILVTLGLATIALPRLARGLELPPEAADVLRLDLGRAASADAAIAAVEAASRTYAGADRDAAAAAAATIVESYRRWLEERNLDQAVEPATLAVVTRDLRLAGLAAERDAVRSLARARQLDEHTVQVLLRDVDLREVRLHV